METEQELEKQFGEAESLRKEKKYNEACNKFHLLWQKTPNVKIGWRYVHCLRKLGRLEDAEKIAQEVLQRYSEEECAKGAIEQAKRELGWVWYQKDLKTAEKTGNLQTGAAAANKILGLNPDSSQLITSTVLSMMRIAKRNKNWKVVIDWADRLTANNLDDRPRILEGRRGMSEREEFYVIKARALLELGRHKEARQLAYIGLKDFPQEFFLLRTAALALARSGDLDGAKEEMRALLSHPRADWYLKAELALLEFQTDNFAEAYRLMCDALDNSQAIQYKVGHIALMARIALALGKLDVAAEHVELAKAVRLAQQWNIPSQLKDVEIAVKEALNAAGRPWPELPKDPKQLERICYRRWQEGAVQGVEYWKGTVKDYPEGRPFAFIQRDDGGEDVYVKVKDLPMDCRKPGSRVEFVLERSFDSKKGRESFRASRVRCVKSNNTS